MTNTLNRAATVVQIGFLTLIFALPVLTLFAALKAAMVTVTEHEDSTVTAAFWKTFRRCVTVSVKVQLVWSAAIALGIFDVAMAMASDSRAAGFVATAGAAVVTASVALLPFLVTSCGAGNTIRQVGRTALVRAGARPLISLALMALTALTALLVVTLPIGAPLYLSGWAWITATVVSHGDAVLRRVTGLHVRNAT